MKNLISTFLLLLVFVSVNSQTDPKKIYLSHLNNVQKFINFELGENVSGDAFMPSVLFLENLTGIECDYEESIDLIKIPSKKNLKAWKKWYKKNNALLYWNENQKTVMVKYLKVPE